MDRFTNVIPIESSEEIRKRIAERDGEDNEQPSAKRARADTTAHLPAYLPQIDQPPKAEADLNKYDYVRLQQGLSYVIGEMKRKITPRTAAFLEYHKDAYKVALERDASDPASLAVVQYLDKVYASGVFYFKVASQQEQDQLDWYLRLRRLELLANYGDYLGQESQHLKADIEQKADDHDEAEESKPSMNEPTKSKTWKMLAEGWKGHEAPELRQHVSRACAKLGLDSTHMRWLIEQWGLKRNHRTFHCRIREHIAAYKWGDLATQLGRDLAELVIIIKSDDNEMEGYEKTMVLLRDRYLIVGDPLEPGTWLPSQHALDLIKARYATEAEKGGSSGQSK